MPSLIMSSRTARRLGTPATLAVLALVLGACQDTTGPSAATPEASASQAPVFGPSGLTTAPDAMVQAGLADSTRSSAGAPSLTPSPAAATTVGDAAGAVSGRPSLAQLPHTSVLLALGTARSNGFTCSNTYKWVRNNFPQITSITGNIENTYFYSELYRYSSIYGWQPVRKLGWYGGASNAYGQIPLTSGYSTNYWMLVSNSSAVGDLGAVHLNLTPGYYATKEFYRWQNGASASLWSTQSGTGAAYCQIT
jgi:hypothetical protein